jgi:phosphoribosylanthranilate isomerase
MKVKICGLTRLQDACVAVESGADMLGFIFYPKSKRYVAPEQVTRIISHLPPETVTVGVFVNETVEHVRSVARIAGLTRVQLHGTESAETVAALSDLQPIKALPLKPESEALLSGYAGATLLVDTPCAGWGGSGETGDWELAARWSAERSLLLSGGLSPDNLAEAVQRVRPAGIDVASGVEISPGIKDPDLIRAFIAAARQIA